MESPRDRGTWARIPTRLRQQFYYRQRPGLNGMARGNHQGIRVVGRRMFDLGEKHGGDNTHRGQPVFVVTHRPKATITKQGGTTYNFVTGGIERTLSAAREAAGDRDVVVLGGATTIQECIMKRPD